MKPSEPPTLTSSVRQAGAHTEDVRTNLPPSCFTSKQTGPVGGTTSASELLIVMAEFS